MVFHRTGEVEHRDSCLLYTSQELLEKFDKESKTRTFVSPAVAMAYKIFAILVTLYHLVFASGFWMPETLKHRSLHVLSLIHI